MATTKVQQDHLKESVDTKINNDLTNLESSLTRTISNLDSKFASKISALESKMDSKFEILEKDIKHIVVELKAELGKHEIRLVWRMFFAVSIVLISLYPTF
jgi:hypothetical protein